VREKDIIDGDYHIHWLEEFLAKGGMDARRS
jgi:acetyl-CoA carboxylase biotin carboxylase subunit